MRPGARVEIHLIAAVPAAAQSLEAVFSYTAGTLQFVPDAGQCRG